MSKQCHVYLKIRLNNHQWNYFVSLTFVNLLTVPNIEFTWPVLKFNGKIKILHFV